MADDLTKHKIEVILDQTKLKAGVKLYKFMEESVKNAEYILVICTPKFISKFDEGNGSIAIEQEMIIEKLRKSYKENEDKIIPILRRGTPYETLPTYLGMRLCLDFKDDGEYDENFEILLTTLRIAHNTLQKMKPPSSDQTSKNYISASPKKWIKVVGTGVGLPLSEKLQKTSQSLGELLARNHYGLITGGWPGVDDTVSRAFARELEANSLPLENFLVQIMEETRIPEFPAGIIKYISTEQIKQNKYIVFDKSIERADALILIGGRGSTRWAGFEGLRKNKAVFPLADTGSDAKDVYLSMIKEWPPEPNFFKDIDKETFQIVAREAPGVVNHLLPLLKTL